MMADEISILNLLGGGVLAVLGFGFIILYFMTKLERRRVRKNFMKYIKKLGD